MFINIYIFITVAVLAFAFCAGGWYSTSLKYSKALRRNVVLKRKLRRVEEKSRTDMVTGLLSRRAGVEELELLQREIARLIERENYEVNLIVFLFDLDEFKDVNDRYGHALGDKTLRFFAERLQEAFPRAGDLLIRWGGDEFVAAVRVWDDYGKVLHATRVCIAHVREKLQVDLSALTDEEHIVSCSFGHTLLVANGQIKPIASIIEEVDARMYEHKNKNPCS